MPVLRYFLCTVLLVLIFSAQVLAVDCSTGGGISTIGVEYVPDTCPPYGDNEVTHFVDTMLTCSGGEVTLYAHYGDSLNTPAAIASYAASNNYRVMWNKDNGHIVMVHRYFRGTIDGVSMTSVPSGTINTEGFDQIFMPNAFPDADGNGNPDCADSGDAPEVEKEPEPVIGACEVGNRSFGSQVNVASGNLSLTQSLFSEAETGLPGGLYFSWNSLGNGWQLNQDVHYEPTWAPAPGIAYTCTQSVSSWTAILSSDKNNDNGVVYPVKWTETGTDLMVGSCSIADAPYIRVRQADGGYLYFSDTSSGSDLASVNGSYATWSDEDHSVTYRNGTQLTFNDDGKILERRDRNGLVAQYSYIDDQLQSITDRFGRTTVFSHDGDGHVSTITAPDGRSVSLTYSGEHVASMTTSDGRTWSYTYSDGRLTQISDPAGNEKSYAYDSSGRVVQGTTPDGTRTISYDDSTNESVITDRDGSQTIHGYDADQRTPIYTIDAQGGETLYTYNSRNQLTSTSDQELRSRTSTYSTQGDLVTETDAAGITTSYTYNSNGDVTAVTDAMGNTTQIAYDANGNPITVTLANGLQIINTYNSLGQLVSRQDVNGGVTGYTYDANGFPAQVIAPDGSVTTYSFDNGGRLLTETDAGGYVTSYTYDNAGRLAGKTMPGGDTTSYGYNVLGHLTSVLHPDGTTTSLTYDHAGRLLSLIDGAGRSTHYQYNNLGQRTVSTDGNSNSTDYTSNFMDQLTRITDPLGTVTDLVYQDDGLSLAEVIDGRGNSLTYSYDSAGRLIQTNQHGVITSYTYNSLGQLATRTDARAIVTEYSYDSLGRLTQLHFPADSSQDVLYGYDAGTWGGGQLTSMQDAGGSHSYAYDSLGRLVSHTYTLQNTAYATGYSYDATGNLVTLSYPGGFAVTTSYDGNHRPLSIQAELGDQTLDILTQIGYDTNGRPVQWQHGNGLLTSAGYDGGGLLQNLTLSSHLAEEYSRDGTGQLTALTRTVPTTGQDIYQYDVVGQLISADKNSILRTYSYDPVGNRLTLNEDGEIDTSTLATDSNQLLAVSGVNAESRLYDIQGNSLQLSTPLFDDLQLTYNQSGRLKTLSNSGTVSDYLYDGNNLRVVKDSDGVVTHYHYDLQGRLLAETDSDGTLRRAVVWYGDTPAALIDIEQSGPTFYTCTTTESLTGAAGPGMTLDTVTHTVVIEDGDYAGTYAISDENWQVYSSGIVFIWSGESFRLEGGFAPDYELPTRSGALFVYQEDDEGNSQVIDVYKLWKESESGGSTIATPYQVHTDQIGAPILLTDATGTAVWSAQYAPFGQATINNDVDGDGTEVVCNLRFPGQYFDAESGLHYNWHRYYEPRSGRYITLDPIGLAGGINLYAYANRNPVNVVDPTGEIGIAGAAAIITTALTSVVVYITVDCIDKCSKKFPCNDLENPDHARNLEKCADNCLKFLKFLGFNTKSGLLSKAARKVGGEVGEAVGK
ncbi:RHS repeat-associated core domain-containing protein [Desulfuromonas acetoxidans]|uniref:RHS repeat-associated core domain-containing protein n=1 Tax=Desulfuromonas acetoxidans TaxID=891 RepID=UPI001883692F|nr:RHS repeat-associated core domain-containing protein [Desulfuromonas acetoxidans]MBF0644491.1 RHS domain-containing protein [Desulfuromonas acetoxidans]